MSYQLGKELNLRHQVQSVHVLPLVSGRHAFLGCVCVEKLLKNPVTNHYFYSLYEFVRLCPYIRR
jgi:hypothetical protein